MSFSTIAQAGPHSAALLACVHRRLDVLLWLMDNRDVNAADSCPCSVCVLCPQPHALSLSTPVHEWYGAAPSVALIHAAAAAGSVEVLELVLARGGSSVINALDGVRPPTIVVCVYSCRCNASFSVCRCVCVCAFGCVLVRP